MIIKIAMFWQMFFFAQALWFGGDVARIVGECACPRGMRWDDYEMECENDFLGGVGTVLGVVAGIALLFILCCCGCAAFFLLRKIF